MQRKVRQSGVIDGYCRSATAPIQVEVTTVVLVMLRLMLAAGALVHHVLQLDSDSGSESDHVECSESEPYLLSYLRLQPEVLQVILFTFQLEFEVWKNSEVVPGPCTDSC
jgi:hypothetical protein